MTTRSQMWSHPSETALVQQICLAQEKIHTLVAMIDQRIPPAMLDASSDSDTSLVIIIHTSRELH